MKCSCSRSASARSDRAVERDHAPERGHRIAGEGLLVRRGERLGDRHAAGVVVLDDHARGLLELVQQPPRRVEVQNVVERERPAVELRHPREHVRAGAHLDVQRGLLVRVLAVGQVEELLVRHHPVAGERLVPHAEPAADRARRIAAVNGERLVRQPVAGLAPRRRRLTPRARRAPRRSSPAVTTTATKRWFFAAALIIVGPPMSMFSTASSSLTSRLADRALERVEVHAHEVDRLDPLGLERRHVLGVVADRQQAPRAAAGEAS